MSESGEWPEYYFELRHARRIKKLEDRLVVPTILFHIGNILFLRETKWNDSETTFNPTPHLPRPSNSISFPLLDPNSEGYEDINPIFIVYLIYILALGVALIAFSLARLFSPTLNRGITEEAVSVSRARSAAGATILTMFMVLPLLFTVYPRWALLLSVFLLYKAYAITVLSNYLNILKFHGSYFSCANQQNTYPTDHPISDGEDLSFYVDERDSAAESPNRNCVGGNVTFDAMNVQRDPPPSYDEAVKSNPPVFPIVNRN